MSLRSFFETNVSMKVNRKYSRIGAEVRCSGPYLKELARLVYKGWNVFDKIYYEPTGKNEGTGRVTFACLPQTLQEVSPKCFELPFTYKTSRWRVKIGWETEEERFGREASAVMEKHRIATPDESSPDTEEDEEEDIDIQDLLE